MFATIGKIHPRIHKSNYTNRNRTISFEYSRGFKRGFHTTSGNVDFQEKHFTGEEDTTNASSARPYRRPIASSSCVSRVAPSHCI